MSVKAIQSRVGKRTFRLIALPRKRYISLLNVCVAIYDFIIIIYIFEEAIKCRVRTIFKLDFYIFAMNYLSTRLRLWINRYTEYMCSENVYVLRDP